MVGVRWLVRQVSNLHQAAAPTKYSPNNIKMFTYLLFVFVVCEQINNIIIMIKHYNSYTIVRKRRARCSAACGLVITTSWKLDG